VLFPFNPCSTSEEAHQAGLSHELPRDARLRIGGDGFYDNGFEG